MSEIRTLLERKRTELHAPAGSFERLILHRDRKRRNQRIAAGIVGIAVFVPAVIVTSVGALDSTQRVNSAEDLARGSSRRSELSTLRRR